MLTHGMIKFLSIELHETMALFGTDEASLTEIIMSRSNQELADIRDYFVACKYFSNPNPNIYIFEMSTIHH